MTKSLPATQMDIPVGAGPKSVSLLGRLRKATGKPAARAMSTIAILAAAGGLAALMATNWDRWAGERRLQTTDDAFIASNVRPLSARAAGYVRKVLVNDFEKVKAGQTIVEIVDDDYRARVMKAMADLAAAKTTLGTLHDQIAIQQANARAAKATAAVTAAALHRDRLEAIRQHSLFNRGLAGTRQKVEVADAALEQDEASFARDKAKVAAAVGEIAMLRSEVVRQEALVASAKAALELAQIDLGYTKIVAPVDGMIGRRLVQPGQYVNIGTQVTSLVPLPLVWVVANYRETQMTRIRRGDAATISVDAFPDIRLRGHVEGWSPATGSVFSLLPPDNATGNFTKVVQRVPVKIVIDSDNHMGDLLRPGMSVTVTIDTSSHRDGLGVARAAEPSHPH